MGSAGKGSVMDRWYILESRSVRAHVCVCTCARAHQRGAISTHSSPSFGQVGKHFLKKIFLGNLFLAGLDLHCCEGVSLVAVSRGDSPAAVLPASHCGGSSRRARLWDVAGFSRCRTWAQ